MKTIYYWCSYISKVATVRAVMKSAEAMKKFSNNKLDPIIINVAGEWEAFKKDNKFQIKIIDLTKSKIIIIIGQDFIEVDLFISTFFL